MQPRIFQLKEDIKVYCVNASSFPAGIEEAHKKLHSFVKFDPKRKYFGVSAPDKSGKIIYKAAAEELNAGELSKHNLEPFIIKKGNYIYTDIKDFRSNIMVIGTSFHELLHNPGIDTQGCCVEWYMDDSTCRCMVRLEG